MNSEGGFSALGDHVSLQRGTTYKSSLLGQPGPVLLGLASIARNGGFRSDSLRTYGGQSAEKLLLYPGDLYVSLKDVTQSADLLGSIARVPDGVAVGRLTQDTVKLDFKSDIPLGYLYWLLRTPQYRQYCHSHAIGTTNLSLSREDFLDFPVPYSTQDRLALTDLLQALDDKIAINDGIRNTCYQLGDALIRAKNARTERTVSLEELARAGELAFGDGYRTKRSEHGRPGLPILRVAEVQNGYISPKMEDLVKEIFRPAMGAKTSKPGDVILTTKGTVGRVAIIPDDAPEFVYSPQLCYFRISPNSSLSASYLFYWFRSEDFWSQARSLKNQTDMADYLNLGDIKSLKIKMPSAGDASEFLAKISHLELMATKSQSESRALATLRDTLLPKLMSGEIRVRDAEKLVEDAA